jgi:hypothetical protein
VRPLASNPMPKSPPPGVFATRGPTPLHPSTGIPRLSQAWRVKLTERGSIMPWRRWTASVTCGIMIVGEPGYVWGSRTRAGVVAKVARSAAKRTVMAGESTIVIEIEG